MPAYKYVILGYVEGVGWPSRSLEPGNWKLQLPQERWSPFMRTPPIPESCDLPTLLSEGWVPVRETSMGGPVWVSDEELWGKGGPSALVLLVYQPDAPYEYAYAFVCDNSASELAVEYTALAGKTMCELADLLELGWAPVRETYIGRQPAFTRIGNERDRPSSLGCVLVLLARQKIP